MADGALEPTDEAADAAVVFLHMVQPDKQILVLGGLHASQQSRAWKKDLADKPKPPGDSVVIQDRQAALAEYDRLQSLYDVAVHRCAFDPSLSVMAQVLLRHHSTAI